MSNRIITFNHAKLNYDAYKKQTIPDSNECMTKSDVLNYINVDETLITTYANNQLVPTINVVGMIQDFSDYCYYFNGTVSDVAVQSDGKIIVVGHFTKYKNVTANKIIRLNPDGTVDNTFNYGSGFNTVSQYEYGNEIKVVKLQSDGKILVGGIFDNYNGTTAYCLIRLNIDGSVDSTFNAGLLFASGGPVEYSPTVCKDILIHNNNIYVCGYGLNTGTINYLLTAKLNMNGVLDTTFQSNLNIAFSERFGEAYSIITDGNNLFIGGWINSTQYNSKVIKKVSFNGIVDNAFSIGTTNTNVVTKLCYDNTNSSILYGWVKLMKMSTNGTPDVNFNSNASSESFNSIKDIKVDSQGRILIAGV